MSVAALRSGPSCLPVSPHPASAPVPSCELCEVRGHTCPWPLQGKAGLGRRRGGMKAKVSDTLREPRWHLSVEISSYSCSSDISDPVSGPSCSAVRARYSFHAPLPDFPSSRLPSPLGLGDGERRSVSHLEPHAHLRAPGSRITRLQRPRVKQGPRPPVSPGRCHREGSLSQAP